MSISELRDFYLGRRVLVTGHTGFKGGWLTRWLNQLGAEVHAFGLAPDQGPDNLFERAQIARHCRSSLADIREFDATSRAVEDARPEIVFHLAARALVQHGYDDPIGTFATNTLGTANVLEASRRCETVAAVVCVTTDKVYLNQEWAWPYRESDELGGLDPYSASKAAAELIARSYRNTLAPKDRKFALATARGGNVIGGGDWSSYRLAPDVVRAIRAQTSLRLRYPGAVRPWQHVLDLCYGYLLLGLRLTRGDNAAVAEQEAFNFGPASGAELTVSMFVDQFLRSWGGAELPVKYDAVGPYEAMTLRLDSSLANRHLGWRPRLDAGEAIDWTAAWYRAYVDDPANASALMARQIETFETLL